MAKLQNRKIITLEMEFIRKINKNGKFEFKTHKGKK